MKNDNSKYLKPFKSGDDSRRNLKGRPKKTITDLLRELGGTKKISFNIEITDSQGITKTMSGEIKGVGSKNTINQIIATQLLHKAVSGNLIAIREVLDRVEGRPNQAVDITTDGDKINETIITVSKPENIDVIQKLLCKE